MKDGLRYRYQRRKVRCDSGRACGRGDHSQEFQGDRPKGRTLKVCAWVVHKRTHPDVTLDEMGDFIITVKGEEDEADPTPAPGS